MRLAPPLVLAALLGAPAAAQTTQPLPGTPHQINVNCTMADGAIECTVPVPPTVGKKVFLVQTVSVYHVSTVGALQVYVDPRFGGSYAAFAVPPAQPSGTSYPGATLNASFFTDKNGGEISAFRSTSSGSDTVYVSLSGLPDHPALLIGSEGGRSADRTRQSATRRPRSSRTS